MKFHFPLTLAILCLVFVACSNDDEVLAAPVDETITDPTPPAPCEVNFSNIAEDEVVIINCNIDLEGQAFVLPKNVTIKNEGGTLTNGSIVFDNGLIDGSLLNKTLTITGEARLIDSHFIFEKGNWDIIEDIVTDEIALQNKINLNNLISLVHNLGGTIFELDEIDAFFDVQADNYNEATQESIILPSNFHFKMSNNTHLRVQPNSKSAYALLSAKKQVNVTISGGNLWGDRYTHSYVSPGSDGNTHEFGYMVYFRGVHNGTVDGVGLREATGDGFIMQGTSNRYNDGTVRPGEWECKNIVVKNCIIDKNRRNNLSLVDGDGAIIENNIISNGGDGGEYSVSQDGYSSKGVLPRYNIDLEAINTLSPDGNTVYYTEIIKNVIIRNNEFTGAHHGDIDLYKCWDVEIHNNTFSSYIANVAAYNIQIHHNSFINDGDRKFAIQIKSLVRPNGYDYNRNYEVYDNTISNYEVGLKVGGTNQEINNNIFENCDTGIMFLEGIGLTFNNNMISSSSANSVGYFDFPGGVNIDDYMITGGQVNVVTFPFLAIKINNNDNSYNSGVTFDNVLFNSTSNYNVDLRQSKHITIKNSTYNGIRQVDCENITLINNN